MRLFMILAFLATLAACGENTAEQSEIFARDAAKQTVNTVVARQFPGVNVAPYTDCIIDSASLPELVELANATMTGITPATTNLVLNIASRQTTVQCALDKSLGIRVTTS